MKNLKKIELPKMDLHPQHRLSASSMGNIQGGAGCICYRNPFNLNDGCACNKKRFGICSRVNGGGPGPGNGCTNNLGSQTGYTNWENGDDTYPTGLDD